MSLLIPVPPPPHTHTHIHTHTRARAHCRFPHLAPPAHAPLTFLHACSVSGLIKDYCGVLSEESMRVNFVLVYELLDEIIDFGSVSIVAGTLSWFSSLQR